MNISRYFTPTILGIILFSVSTHLASAETAITMPAAVTVTSQTSHAIGLSWTSDCTDCQFRLQYGEAADLSDATTVSGITNPEKTLYDLSVDTHYYYSVAAYSDEATSDYTAIQDSWTLPAKVTGVTVSRSDRYAERVTIAWDTQSDVTQYRLRIYNQANDEIAYKKTMSDSKDHLTVSLGEGQNYYVRVAAMHRERVGAYSAAVNFKTRSYESDDSIWNTSANCLAAASQFMNSRCWLLGDATLTGNITVSDDIYTLKETAATTTRYMQDIDLGSVNGKYLLFISKTYAETVGEHITSLPYLYGYQMATANRITDYFQDTTALFNGEEKTWDVSYELDPVTSNLDRMRLFLNQASYSGEDETGSAGKFKFVGFFIVNSAADAQAIIEEYQETL